MQTFILPSFIKDTDEDLVGRRMNALFTDMMTNASFCDCQSHPIKTYFGDLYQQARFSITNSFEKYKTGIGAQLRPVAKMIRYVEQTPYADILQDRAEVPEGLSVSYLEYLEPLTRAQERANNIVEGVIRPFAKYIAKLTTDATFRNGIRHSIREFTDLEKGHKELTDEMAACFQKNSYSATAPFQQVVRRNGDWSLVFAQTEKLKKLYDKYDHKEVTKALNSLYENINELMKVIQNDDLKNVEKDLTQQLAIGMYSVAREVEFSAHTTFRTITFIKTMNTTIESFEKKKRL